MSVAVIVGEDGASFIDPRNPWFCEPLFRVVKDISKDVPTINIKSVKSYEHSIWSLLHEWCEHDVNSLYNFMLLMSKHYRCTTCKNDLVEWLELHPMNKRNMKLWMKEYHDHVDQISNKAFKVDTKDCDKGELDGYTVLVNDNYEIYIPKK